MFFNLKQNLTESKYKEKYGEVNTDFNLIEKMLGIIPEECFTYPSFKWLDPCCGHGYFMIILFKKLYVGLKKRIPNDEDRKNHIIEKMLYMVEINEEHIPKLRELFGEKANIYNEDFLKAKLPKFNIIIGNPPFNSKGIKKVPTNKKSDKLKDGITIWPAFLKHSVSILKKKGYLVMITPSIWMRPDRAKMYYFLTQFNISKIHCFTNTETNKLFHGSAQTPTCFFLLQNSLSPNRTSLFDKQLKIFTPWFFWRKDLPIPVFASHTLYKLQKYVKIYGNLNVIKTNMPDKKAHYNEKFSFITPYPNVKTCLLDKNQPYLKINYTNRPIQYSGTPKLILAHKMYGFPFFDDTGKFGISNRDNYIIIGKSRGEMLMIRDFLSTRFARYLFEATRYRMKYLEKNIFELLPDITKFYRKNKLINDNELFNLFNLEPIERKVILEFHKKDYLFCIEKSTQKKAPPNKNLNK